jgi:hypothetical protein
MKITTDRIYSIDNSSTPTPRIGDVIIDDDEVFTDLRDTERIIHVTDGLEPLDVAVYFEFLDDSCDSQLERKIGGFIVGTLNPDGSGVLVSIDALSSYRAQLMTPKLDARLALLADADLPHKQTD